MPIYNLVDLLDRYSNGFLILDFNHLFISSSIREEVWLLQRRKDSTLTKNIKQAASEFGIHEVTDDKDFETYSGGQKAILGCLLTLAVIRDQNVYDVKLLLNNVLDSVSGENRSRLAHQFDQIRLTHNTRIYLEKDGHIREIFSGDANTQG